MSSKLLSNLIQNQWHFFHSVVIATSKGSANHLEISMLIFKTSLRHLLSRFFLLPVRGFWHSYCTQRLVDHPWAHWFGKPTRRNTEPAFSRRNQMLQGRCAGTGLNLNAKLRASLLVLAREKFTVWLLYLRLAEELAASACVYWSILVLAKNHDFG